jgi:copper chaperone CopZ
MRYFRSRSCWIFLLLICGKLVESFNNNNNNNKINNNNGKKTSSIQKRISTTLHPRRRNPLRGSQVVVDDDNYGSPNVTLETYISHSVVSNKYHLLWSPNGILPLIGSFLMTTLLTFTLRRSSFLTPCRVHDMMQFHSSSPTTKFIGRIWNQVGLPLLASSCCMIQLLLNILIVGGGCAGWNTILGPLRPYFFGFWLSTMTTGSSPIVVGMPIQQQKQSWILLSWILACMPELVHIWNTIIRLRIDIPSSQATIRNKKNVNEDNETDVTIHIPGMGCVACIANVQGTILKKVSNVSQCQVWLNEDTIKSRVGGMARVRIKYDDMKQDPQNVHDARTNKEQELLEAIQSAGFPDCYFVDTRILPT